jgi:hypothetical protein
MGVQLLVKILHMIFQALPLALTMDNGKDFIWQTSQVKFL